MYYFVMTATSGYGESCIPKLYYSERRKNLETAHFIYAFASLSVRKPYQGDPWPQLAAVVSQHLSDLSTLQKAVP